MPRRALNVVAASMPLLALSAAVAVGEGPLRYHVPYVCNGERIVVSRCRSDSDQPGFPPTQPGSDYCAVVYPIGRCAMALQSKRRNCAPPC
jgi:hypothetical protein